MSGEQILLVEKVRLYSRLNVFQHFSNVARDVYVVRCLIVGEPASTVLQDCWVVLVHSF